jgi:hypothetical protein
MPISQVSQTKLPQRYSRRPHEIDTFLSQLGDQPYVVDGMIPARSVNLLAGDSGLGKTPFTVQMAVCVSAGIPFLGMETTRGPVLYVDFENNPGPLREMSRQISMALGLPDTPEDFYAMDAPTSAQIEHDAKILKPSLIVIDTLRPLDPGAEEKNTAAALRLLWFKQFQKLGSSVVFIHHMRKEDRKEPRASLLYPKLKVMEWMAEVSGASALVNQSDVRIGFDSGEGSVEAVARAHQRGVGELGPWRLGRVRDDQGKEVAYRLVKASAAVLTEPLRSDVGKLPKESFTFSQAVTALGKNDRAVADILKQAQSFGVIRKTGKHKLTKYERV